MNKALLVLVSVSSLLAAWAILAGEIFDDSPVEAIKHDFYAERNALREEFSALRLASIDAGESAGAARQRLAQWADENEARLTAHQSRAAALAEAAAPRPLRPARHFDDERLSRIDGIHAAAGAAWREFSAGARTIEAIRLAQGRMSEWEEQNRALLDEAVLLAGDLGAERWKTVGPIVIDEPLDALPVESAIADVREAMAAKFLELRDTWKALPPERFYREVMGAHGEYFESLQSQIVASAAIATEERLRLSLADSSESEEQAEQIQPESISNR